MRLGSNRLALLATVATWTLSACARSGGGDPGAKTVALSIRPESAAVQVRGSVSFEAVGTGTISTAVSWSVDPACGAVTQAGLYTAPSYAGVCQVRVRSEADPTLAAAATVTVTPANGDPPGDPIDPTFRIALVPQAGVSGTQRVNFGLPLPPGLLRDPSRIRIASAASPGAELPTARRALATWPDGSLRSVQIQVEVNVDTTSALDAEVGTASSGATLAMVDVASTLSVADGTAGPRVWAVLPPEWLAPSQVAGPLLSEASVSGTELDAWVSLCDYAAWNVDVFLTASSDRAAWLFDRPTAMYRGHAITGSMSALESAYREAAMYWAGITGTGSSTRIGIPTAESDLKYHYTQGLAIHYLMTGDDRFREAAENVAVRARDLWSDPGYAGGADFWTERHAGFALLAYEWASAVSDDRAATFAAWSEQAVAAYLALQAVDANAWEPDARCFAHHADAHGEPYGYVGCSPWMSAILADGLDAYARRAGGDAALAARLGLARLGRMIARHGRDLEGRPFYWMGAGVSSAEVDPYEEHWGESAYLVALAWHWDGRLDEELRRAALELVGGLRSRGTIGQLRSFNWQCRSGVMAPFFLRP